MWHLDSRDSESSLDIAEEWKGMTLLNHIDLNWKIYGKINEIISNLLVATDLLGSDPYVELFTQGLSSDVSRSLSICRWRTIGWTAR